MKYFITGVIVALTMVFLFSVYMDFGPPSRVAYPKIYAKMTSSEDSIRLGGGDQGGSLVFYMNGDRPVMFVAVNNESYTVDLLEVVKTYDKFVPEKSE